MRIQGRPERRILGRRAHREFIQVRLADKHRALGTQALDHGRVERRHKILQDSRRASRANALGRVDILDTERDSAQCGSIALRKPRIRLPRLLERFFLAHGDERVELRFNRRDPI